MPNATNISARTPPSTEAVNVGARVRSADANSNRTPRAFTQTLFVKHRVTT